MFLVPMRFIYPISHIDSNKKHENEKEEESEKIKSTRQLNHSSLATYTATI